MTPTTAQNEHAQRHDVVLNQRIWSNPQNVIPIDAGSRHSLRRTDYVHERFDLGAACDVSKWTDSRAKRFVDFSVALLLLVLLAPVFCILYAVVRAGSPGPAIFKQERVGKNQQRFTIYKFRTMLHVSGNAPFLRSRQSDSRLTAQGPFLRKYKLDEFPQLVNVLRGEMSLVGPRPKMPELHVGRLPCRPGLTGQASLAFAAEALLVKDIPEHLLEQFHASLITPLKLHLDQEHMKTASFASELGILWRTLWRQGCYRDMAALSGHVDDSLMSS